MIVPSASLKCVRVLKGHPRDSGLRTAVTMSSQLSIDASVSLEFSYASEVFGWTVMAERNQRCVLSAACILEASSGP